MGGPQRAASNDRGVQSRSDHGSGATSSPSTAADTAAETIDRIVHQIVTNDQKRDLSDAQRARGIQQMIDAGLSVTRVAKIHRTS